MPSASLRLICLLTAMLGVLFLAGSVRAGDEEPVPVPVPGEAPDAADAANAAESTEAAEEAVARRPMLWVLEGETPVYLFGTIHLPDPRVTDLMDVVVAAFEASDAFFAEVAFEPGAQAALQGLMFLPADESLDERLGEALWLRVSERLEKQGIPSATLRRMKPWIATMRLLQEAITPPQQDADSDESTEEGEGEAVESAVPEQAMDLTLYQNAAALGKETGGLEKFEEQIAVFDGQPLEDQRKMLEEMLDVIEQMDDDDGGEEGADAKEFRNVIESLILLYLAGDDVGLGQAMADMTAEGGETLAAFMADLIDKRNVVMVERLLEAREKRPGKVLFVAVGAGHYPGEKGILALLGAMGHEVRRLEADAEIPVRMEEVIQR